MSVAVAMPHTAHLGGRQAHGIAVPAQTDLLEALLASCKPRSHTPLPNLVGRELEPFFSHAEKPTPRSTNTSPKRATKKGGAPKKAAKLTTAQAEKARATQMAAIMSSWAGPGFCVAPSPDQLPMPTAALLG